MGWFVVRLLKLFLSLSLLSTPAWADLPEITAHTPIDLQAHRGDKIVVEARFARPLAKGVKVLWSRFGEVFCRAARCLLETATLGLGDHRVVFTLQRGGVGKSISVRLKVIPAPPGYRPKLVEPVLQPPSQVLDISERDTYIHAATGRGFARRGGRTRVISEAKQTLLGETTLTTREGGLLRFGQHGVEEHTLFANARLEFTVSGEQRFMNLQKGTLRTRSISSGEAGWSILADSLQVDPGPNSDMVIGISAKSRAVLITVLRGQVRVTRLIGERQMHRATDIEQITLPQGVYVRVDKSDSAPLAFRHPPIDALERAFALSSPQYLPNQRSSWVGETVVVSGESVEKLLARRDYIAALQKIWAMPTADWTAEQLGQVAKCYAGLFQYSLARRFIDQLAKKSPAMSAEILELKASMALAARRYKEAAASYKDASNKSSHSRLFYYRGVSEYFLGNRANAETAFTYVLWEQPDMELRDSTQKFLGALNRETFLRSSIAIGALHNTNVTRVSNGPESRDEPRASGGYLAELGLTFQLVTQASIRMRWELHAEHTGWVVENLLDHNQLGLMTSVPLEFFVPKDAGGATDKAVFGFGLAPSFGRETLGGIPNADMTGARLWLGTPRWFNLRAMLETRTFVDQTPSDVNARDPLLGQSAVIASDRSTKDVGYGLALAPIEDKAWDADVNLWHRTANYRDELVQTEDHRTIEFAASLRYLPSPRYHLSAGIDNLTRDFHQQAQRRRDARFGFHLSGGWYFHPKFWMAVHAESISQTSNTESASYTQQTVSLRTGLTH